MQLEFHLSVFFLQFLEFLNEKQVGLSFILIGLVHNLLQDKDLPLQCKDLITKPLFDCLLLRTSQYFRESSYNLMAISNFFTEFDEGCLVELAEGGGLLQF